MIDHSTYKAESGTLTPVWRIEIQTRPDDANRLLGAIVPASSIIYGQYFMMKLASWFELVPLGSTVRT